MLTGCKCECEWTAEKSEACVKDDREGPRSWKRRTG